MTWTCTYCGHSGEGLPPLRCCACGLQYMETCYVLAGDREDTEPETEDDDR